MRGTGLVCVPVVPLGTLAYRLSRQVGMFGFWPMVPWRVGALAQGGCGAQVHHGVLWDGREVAVKVQYLGLETAVTADLACLAAMAAAAARLLPAAPDLRWMVADLRSNLAQELDFQVQRMRCAWLQECRMCQVPAVQPCNSSARGFLKSLSSCCSGALVLLRGITLMLRPAALGQARSGECSHVGGCSRRPPRHDSPCSGSRGAPAGAVQQQREAADSCACSLCVAPVCVVQGPCLLTKLYPTYV